MKRAEELIEKYNLGTATPEEKAIVESWYLKYKTPPSDLKPADLVEEHRLGLEKLQHSLREKKIIKFKLPISVAACLLLFIGIGWFFMNSKSKWEQEQFMSNNLLPETNSVILTLANGKKVTIAEGNTGEIVADDNFSISQTADGQLVYTITDNGKGERPTEVAYNTIETPKGNQYKIVLPDGSHVFLSAASKLRYPVRFSEKERRVELVGQAHFEIVPAYSSSKRPHLSRSTKIPFIVKAGNQEVEVLGTQFNVNAYEDDETMETALIEGSVKVSITGTDAEVLLKPGQKAINGLHTAQLKVEEFDVADLKAWKEGYFIFNNENIKDIMKKLARWYGFEVEYMGNMTDVAFQGNYLRTRDVKHLLKTLEMANSLQFEIIDKNGERRIIVHRKNL
ncbi:DUF4974 domain-containing protein [Sphingobacterium phlebotomi]|uniref:DUF4974 domain-containing protein n=1 Tax=Sphingobacterium phlebotomi TaxID=2605433 RepID=A0A5D4HA72_9SPHI|nr:FecR family protein [Sphingobacterium phlebotomi]TYR37537.1 DUF4974 domain-containing protein [Sphingobacterium phlebotomi]